MQRTLAEGAWSRAGAAAGDERGGKARRLSQDSERGDGVPRAAVKDEAECPLCLKVLYEPVSTPCGHSFCRPCLSQSLDHRNKCPLCRTVLLMTPSSLTVNVTLSAMLQRAFPAEHAARAEEEAQLLRPAPPREPATALLPLFVMDVVLPRQRIALNVFEPRYRLMVRRAMAGSRRFAMVGVDRERELLPIACEVEITECEALPDGRFAIEVLGRRRVRLAGSEEQDGYRLGRCELPPGGGEADEADDAALRGDGESLAALAHRVEAQLAVWVARLGDGDLFNAALARVGPRPPSEQHSAVGWWVAALLPLSATERYRLLEAGSARERLQRELLLLSGRQDGACCVQ